MQNDSTEQPVTTVAKARSDFLEAVMFGFGALAVVSLIVNNGFLLKISAAIFLVVAATAIVRGLNRTGHASPTQQPTQPQIAQPVDAATLKKRKIIKIVGITVLLIIAAPFIGQILLVVLFLILLAFNGGNMDMGS